MSPVPHALFLSSLTGPVAGYETSAARFFGGGGRSKPAEVASGTLSDRADVRLAPGQAHTLAYAYGYGDAAGISPLVARLAGGARTALAASEAAWRQSLPRLAMPRDTWLGRETAWDYYYLRSSETYEDAWRTSVTGRSGLAVPVPGPRADREQPTGIGTTGGIWYALNGPDVWALGPVDAALAYREYRDNTRAAYAHAYPDNWFGVLSGPDSYGSFESGQAGQPSSVSPRTTATCNGP